MAAREQRKGENVAEEVMIRGTNATAKKRNPVGVLALNFITLGIYGVFWWYFINREMAELGRANNTTDLGDNPGMSVLAVTLGSFILVPPFVSLWNTCKRIEKSQNLVLGQNNFSPVLALVLTLLLITAFIPPILMQSNLNQVWDRQR